MSLRLLFRRQGSDLLVKIPVSPPVADTLYTMRLVWQCGTWTGSTVSATGFVQVYVNGVLVYQLTGQPFFLGNSGNPNQIGGVSFGYKVLGGLDQISIADAVGVLYAQTNWAPGNSTFTSMSEYKQTVNGTDPLYPQITHAMAVTVAGGKLHATAPDAFGGVTFFYLGTIGSGFWDATGGDVTCRILATAAEIAAHVAANPAESRFIDLPVHPQELSFGSYVSVTYLWDVTTAFVASAAVAYPPVVLLDFVEVPEPPLRQQVGGFFNQPMRIVRHEMDPDTLKCTITLFDLTALYATSFLLGPDTIGGSWTMASNLDQQRYGYLSNETGLYSDGVVGKVLR